MKLRAVDLFSGCGGMSLGFNQAGIDIVAAYDNWEPALSIYSSNFAHHAYRKDLNDPDAPDVIRSHMPDVLIGGPPCQDYSIAGKQRPGARANLTIRFGEIVALVQPQWVVFENVYTVQRYHTLDLLKEILSRAGYGLSAAVLDASYCGVPQKRKRYFLVGKLGEVDGFFDAWFNRGQSDHPVTVRDYVGESFNTDYYYMHPRSYNRRAVFSMDEPAATIRGINRPIPSTYKKHPGDPVDIDDGVRALTTRERATIQTFPASFKLLGPKTDVELAIGNAVPPALARFLAHNMIAYETDRR
ncbi:DNA cytosine methyltransferase [Canibacter sp. lx-72]|uniref:DNA cytosine methyltransferase n=1 Tax=Canibacter zhuwentaonis TaxID=2837491 RepID=UPI001BDBFD4C|nr:DNA cytosine methyltransferase [Canibacter zhuwentaonis]MBT1017571.1 DNA cytosine methyltransferase [Canibacter zhuwentaonis]